MNFKRDVVIVRFLNLFPHRTLKDGIFILVTRDIRCKVGVKKLGIRNI